jgi:AbrB family looped-hinge helix DNA binding protein
MLSTVTTKGQVTIPKIIRDALGIGANDRVAFLREGNRVIIQPLRTLKSLRGAVKAKPASPFADERSHAKGALAERINGEVE